MSSSDKAKIGNEINQLRNQQFLICIAGLTFLGVSQIVVVQILILQIKDPPLTFDFAAMSIASLIAMLIVFTLLYYWVIQLSKVMGRLSAYMVSFNLSEWERRHAEYRNRFGKGFVSQVSIMTRVFVGKGFCALFIPLGLAYLEGSFGYAMIVAFSYAIYIIVLGYLSSTNSTYSTDVGQQYKLEWDKL